MRALSSTGIPIFVVVSSASVSSLVPFAGNTAETANHSCPGNVCEHSRYTPSKSSRCRFPELSAPQLHWLKTLQKLRTHHALMMYACTSRYRHSNLRSAVFGSCPPALFARNNVENAKHSCQDNVCVPSRDRHSKFSQCQLRELSAPQLHWLKHCTPYTRTMS